MKKESGKEEINMEELELQELFTLFLSDKVSPTGGEKMSVKRHIEERMQVYDFYRNKFSPTQVRNLREDEFHYFLTSSGNKSWTNLQRRCKQATSEMEKLRKALLHLQREEIPIEDRLNDVSIGGKIYIRGFGKNLVTALLHIFNPQKHGVWNGRSQKVLNYLNRLPYISSNFGQSYLRVNCELTKLADELKTDLIYLDVFQWWFDENKIKSH
jgi:hypothetical protein